MFKVVCSGCDQYISMGNRYDAEKIIIGKYHTTPVYKFTMNCHVCLCKWEIRTDPQTLDYVCLSGCRRKQENWDTREANGLTTIDSEVKKKLLGDKMFTKEHQHDGKTKAFLRADELRIVEVDRKIRKFDAELNAQLRREARKNRVIEKAKIDEKQEFRDKLNLHSSTFVLSSDEEDNTQTKQLLQKRKLEKFIETVDSFELVRSKDNNTLRKNKPLLAIKTNDTPILAIKAKEELEPINVDEIPEKEPEFIDLTVKIKKKSKSPKSLKRKSSLSETSSICSKSSKYSGQSTKSETSFAGKSIDKLEPDLNEIARKQIKSKQALSLLNKNIGGTLGKDMIKKTKIGPSSTNNLKNSLFSNFKGNKVRKPFSNASLSNGKRPTSVSSLVRLKK